MKLIRPTLALLIFASVTLVAAAQTTGQSKYYRGHKATTTHSSTQALLTLQQDLILAIESMKAALPIYDGNRVRSIHAAHAALLVVDKAISGENALVRTKPGVKDEIASSVAHSKYGAQQIADSQANMRKGYAALQQAGKDLITAEGNTPNQKGKTVGQHLRLATAEAAKAIAIHAGQG